MPTFRAKEAAEPGARPIQVRISTSMEISSTAKATRMGIWRERRIEVSVNKLRLNSASPAA